MDAGDTSPSEVFDEPYPCDGCPYARQCQEQTLSCKSFHIYANAKGTLDIRHRVPSIKWYYKTFIKQRKGEPTAAQVAEFFS